MTSRENMYLGHQYYIEGEDKLVISGKDIDVEKGSNGKYYSRHIPYDSFSNLEDLAKCVIQNSPDFDTDTNKR